MKVIPAWSEILAQQKRRKKQNVAKFSIVMGLILLAFLAYTIPLVAQEVQISRIKLEEDSFQESKNTHEYYVDSAKASTQRAFANH